MSKNILKDKLSTYVSKLALKTNTLSEKILLDRIITFTNFISQPLKLGMFIPCDENGIILPEPERYMEIQTIGAMKSYATSEECAEAENYHFALQNLIFNGFEIEYLNPEEYDDIEFVLRNGNCYVGIKYYDEPHMRLNDIAEKETIEDLICYEIEVTNSALANNNVCLLN